MSRRSSDPERGAPGPVDLRTFAADRLRLAAVALQAQRDGVLAGDARAIHRARTALRRVRSDLRIDRVFDEARTGQLRAEARELGHLLGAVRDRDVIGSRLAARAQALAPGEREDLELVLERLGRERAGAMRELRRPRNVARYDALAAALTTASADPPLPQGGDPLAPAERLVRRSVRRALQKNRDGAARLRRSSTPNEVHELRRAVKRTRYAAEALHELSGRKDHLRLVRDLAEVQDRLGARVDDEAEQRWAHAVVHGSDDARLGFALAQLTERGGGGRPPRRKPVLRRMDVRLVRR